MKIGNEVTIKIGNKEVIYSTALLMSQAEEAQVDIVYSHERIPLSLRFEEEDGGNKISPRIKTSLFEGRLQFTFVNWDNPIGTATTEPVEIATTKDGHTIFVMVAVWSIETTRKINLQYLLGRKDV